MQLTSCLYGITYIAINKILGFMEVGLESYFPLFSLVLAVIYAYQSLSELQLAILTH